MRVAVLVLASLVPAPTHRPPLGPPAWTSPAASAPAVPQERDEGEERYLVLAGLVERGLYDLAVPEGEAFLRDHPRHPRAALARYRLATALVELGRHADALPHLERLARTVGFEYRDEAAYRLGESALALGDPTRARAALAPLADGDGYLAAPARLLLAECALREGGTADAERQFAAVLEGATDDATRRDAEAGLAWCALRLGRHEDAAERAHAWTSRHAHDDPTRADELRLVEGEAFLALGRLDAAEAAFAAVRAEARRAAALDGSARVRAARGDDAGAAELLGAIAALDAEEARARDVPLRRAAHLVRAGDPQAALAELSGPAAPTGAEADLWRAEAHAALGHHEAALEACEHALRASPGPELRARAAATRATALAALGRDRDARRAWEEAGTPHALAVAATDAANAGDPGEALRLAELLLARHPDAPEAAQAALVRAEALFRLERDAEAEQAYAPLAENAPDPATRARALSRLAWLRWRAGDTAGAAERFAALAKAHPDAPEATEALWMEGRAREEAGDAAGAARAWRTLVGRRRTPGPELEQALAGLARVDELDRAADAAQELERTFPTSARRAAAHLAVGDRAAAAGETELAEAAYRRALDADPTNVERAAARAGRGWCLRARGEHAAAARELAAAANEGEAPTPLRASAAELAVWSARDAGDLAGAAAAWRTLAGLASSDAGESAVPEERLVAALDVVARALADAGQGDAARELHDLLLQRVRTPRGVALALSVGAWLALDAGDVDRAEAAVRLAARRSSDAPEVLEALVAVGERRLEGGADARAGELLALAEGASGELGARALRGRALASLRAGDAATAEELLDHALAADPADGEALFLRGEARFRRGSFAPAADDLAACLATRPDPATEARALFRLGLARGELGQDAEAAETLADLARRFPAFENLSEAELGRGRALARSGRAREARAALTRVVERESGVLAARARLELGALAEREGDAEAALAEFLKVAVLFGGDEGADALLRAGRALESLGRTEQARDRYREVLAAHAGTRYADEARERLAASEEGGAKGSRGKSR